MLAILDLWPPVWALAGVYWPDYDKLPLAPGLPPFPKSNYKVPWMGYLSSPLVSGLTPPPGVLTERTAEGGLLMIAAEERLDPTNAEHRKRAEAIMNVMVARAGAHPLNGYDKGGKPWPTPGATP
jgi:hypothetical protein